MHRIRLPDGARDAALGAARIGLWAVVGGAVGLWVAAALVLGSVALGDRVT